MARIRPPLTARRAAEAQAENAEALDRLGFEMGERARFRRQAGDHWRAAIIAGIEADGSLRLTDDRGRARSIPLVDVEVRSSGPRGGATWECAADRASRAHQLSLFG